MTSPLSNSPPSWEGGPESTKVPRPYLAVFPHYTSPLARKSLTGSTKCLFSHLVAVPADKPLGRGHGGFGVHDGLSSGKLADQTLALVRVGDHGGRRSRSLRVGHELGRVTFPDGSRYDVLYRKGKLVEKKY